MLKNILTQNGAKQLSKTEQKAINGGVNRCPPKIICGGTGFDINRMPQEQCENQDLNPFHEWYCGTCYACW